MKLHIVALMESFDISIIYLEIVHQECKMAKKRKKKSGVNN